MPKELSGTFARTDDGHSRIMARCKPDRDVLEAIVRQAKSLLD